MDDKRKPIKWMGSSKMDLASFPRSVVQEAGYQLDQVQQGLLPDDFKTMKSLGKGISGVEEIRLRLSEANSIYRVMYIARFEDAVYVLHCFQKKTQKTSSRDKEVVVKRYKAMLAERQ